MKIALETKISLSDDFPRFFDEKMQICMLELVFSPLISTFSSLLPGQARRDAFSPKSKH